MATLGRVKTVWQGVAGSPYYTTLHFVTDPPGAGMQDAVDSWTDFLDAQDTNFVSALTVTVEPEVDLIDTGSGDLVGAATVSPATVTPAGGGEALPRFTQFLCRLQTSTIIGGRRLRGRFFLPGMQETLNTTLGQPVAALVTSMDASLATFISQSSAPLAVYSPTHHDYGEVNVAKGWTEWAILRSRRD